jgi:uncharacterized protein YodC (DUF2158 family)
MRDLKAGDVVKLKAGGPKMTVNSISELSDHYANVAWFVKGILHTDQIAQKALALVRKGRKS